MKREDGTPITREDWLLIAGCGAVILICVLGLIVDVFA